MPKLRFSPETVEQMKARWPKVMAFSYSAEEIVEKDAIRPGECRENTFDFLGGLRVLASVEMYKGVRYLHLSASFAEGTEEYKSMERSLRRNSQEKAFRIWAKSVTDRFAAVAGDDIKGIQFLGLSRGGVPHWKKELPDGDQSNA